MEHFFEEEARGAMGLVECLLDPKKVCDDCGECNRCDLDPDKTCDNCCRCLGEADYRAVEITEIIMPDGIKLKLKRKKNTPEPEIKSVPKT
jgi:hypothetical protein